MSLSKGLLYSALLLLMIPFVSADMIIAFPVAAGISGLSILLIVPIVFGEAAIAYSFIKHYLKFEFSYKHCLFMLLSANIASLLTGFILIWFDWVVANNTWYLSWLVSATILFVSFIITVLVEWLVIWLFIRKKSRKKSRKYAFILSVVVNVASYVIISILIVLLLWAYYLPRNPGPLVQTLHQAKERCNAVSFDIAPPPQMDIVYLKNLNTSQIDDFVFRVGKNESYMEMRQVLSASGTLVATDGERAKLVGLTSGKVLIPFDPGDLIEVTPLLSAGNNVYIPCSVQSKVAKAE